MSTRYAAKRDDAEPAIVTRLVALGASVTRLDGRDIPDLLVAYKGSWGVAEVKTGKAKVRPGQTSWMASQRATVALLRTPEDAEAWLRSWPPTERAISSAWEDIHESGQGEPAHLNESKVAGRAYLDGAP